LPYSYHFFDREKKKGGLTAFLFASMCSEVVIAPPFVYLSLARDLLRKDISVSGQNLFNQAKGAFTAEIR
jgi:triosephosphate isomerase